MAEKANDPIRPWFDAMEDLGEYIGIRFGRTTPDMAQPEWIFMRHSDFDGIGGLAEIFRRRGVDLPRLMQIKYPSQPSWKWLFKNASKNLAKRNRVVWSDLKQGPAFDTRLAPPPAVAWHVFDENTTKRMRKACRVGGYTLNSFLLKHLSKAIRPFLKDESAVMPWMVPVNLRGKVTRDKDTANHSSYVSVKIRSYENIADIHKNIYAALASGEHWGNWYTYTAGSVLSAGMKKYLIATEKAMYNLGSFSNLGDWDAEKKITQEDCVGDWLFTPPVLRCQMVGAGCVTFQNRLSITIQAHPDLTTHAAVPQAWIYNWVKEIDLDLWSAPAQSSPASRYANSSSLSY